MTAEMLYKLLNEGALPAHGGSGVWSLPANGQPGAWREVEGPLVPCGNGLHLTRLEHLLVWAAPTLYEAEYAGEILEHDNTIVVRRARLLRQVETWNDRVLRLFAADCAERVLPLFEQERPDDRRPREAIEIARLYARGECDPVAFSAARDAAWDAAWDAARAPAWSVARDAAWAAARAATWDAAWDAARAAALSAPWAAEHVWQTERLQHYLYEEQVS